MKLTYGNSELISFNKIFLLVILILLFSEGIFYELILGKTEEGEEAPFNYEKFVLPLCVVVTVLGFFKLPLTLRVVAGIALSYLIILVFESKLTYNTFFIYPHVFSKIMYVFIIFFSYLFFKDVDPKYLKTIGYIVLLAFFLDLLMYNRDVLSFSSFLNTERGFSASSTYLILFVGFYFFNRYLEDNSTFYLIVFLVVMAFVVFLQHRTVWIAAGIIMIVNLLLITIKTKIKVASRISTIVIVVAISTTLLITFVLIDNPEIQKKLVDRFDDIQNYKSEGTGSWRYMQFQSYWPFVLDNWLTGLRFKGFELPIQFYHPDAGVPFFNDGSGHHFHSLYMDKLFYLGIIGLLITFAPLFLYFAHIFKKDNLTVIEIFFTSFIISTITYGISYNWPIFVYAVIGIGYAFKDQKKKEEDIPVKKFNFDIHFKEELVK